MQLTEEITTLKQKIAEAQELSAHHKREMDNNPNNFLFQLRYERFKDFVEQLEEELSECEKTRSNDLRRVIGQIHCDMQIVIRPFKDNSMIIGFVENRDSKKVSENQLTIKIKAQIENKILNDTIRSIERRMIG